MTTTMQSHHRRLLNVQIRQQKNTWTITEINTYLAELVVDLAKRTMGAVLRELSGDELAP